MTRGGLVLLSDTYLQVAPLTMTRLGLGLARRSIGAAYQGTLSHAPMVSF
jgi:hypothetical protein